MMNKKTTATDITAKRQTRIAVITGASSGLGRAYARYLNTHFHLDELWLIARRRDRLEELSSKLHIPCRILTLDLCDTSAINTLKETLEHNRPQIHFLINAAGFGKMGTYKDVPLHELDRMVMLNCQAMMDITQICLPYIPKGGRILEISSVASFQPLPGFGVYAASKAFVTSYSRALRWEVMSRKIRVTAVCPYWIGDTEFIAGTKSDTDSPHAIRHFILPSKAKSVVFHSMWQNKIGLGVSTPGIISSLYRIGAKFVPREIAIAAWQGLRRL